MNGAILTCIVTVSRVTPYFDRLSQLLQEVSSVEQIELIIVHDVQDENSAKLIDSIVARLPVPKITLLAGFFGNPGEARNFALKHVTTPWLIFTDGDDRIFPDAYLKVLEGCMLDCADIAVAGIRVSDVKYPLHSSDHIVDLRVSVEESLGLMPAFTRLIYNTKFIEGLVFPSFLMAEDQCFLFSVLQRRPKFFVSDEIVYEYFTGGSTQLTASVSAINDLKRSIKYLVNSLNGIDVDLLELGFIFVFKQMVTFVLRKRLSSILELAPLFPRLLYFCFRNPIVFLNSIRKIVFYRKALINAKG